MLHKLANIMNELYKRGTLEGLEWDSLIINRRKPHTYRAWTMFGNHRLCLHKFSECEPEEAFLHPHPWPAAFTMMQGVYVTQLGYSKDRFSEPENVSKVAISSGSAYEITSPLTWHSVVPITTCYTIMLNGEPWSSDVAHTQVRTTKGKDLEKMSPYELAQHLDTFNKLLQASWIPS